MRLISIMVVLIAALTSCKKDFLNEKPYSELSTLNSIEEYQKILDNTNVFNKTGSLQNISSDDYYIIDESYYMGLMNETEKNAYIWNKNFYSDETRQLSWDHMYKAIFYANSVLNGLDNLNIEKSKNKDYLIGQALFHRSYAYFDLIRNFCEILDEKNADALGLPIRTKSGIDYISQRASLKETFDFIFNDLENAKVKLKNHVLPGNKLNRPSLTAVYSQLARVHIYLNQFEKAKLYADSALNLFDKLTNFNSICKGCTTPFTFFTDEVIFHSTQVVEYGSLTAVGINRSINIDTNLIKLYEDNDLRLEVNFLKSNSNYNKNRGFIGSGFYDFSGLTTAELLLIRSESTARLGDFESATNDLNQFLSSRYDNFSNLTFTNNKILLDRILQERRKEFVYRGIRWSDLKRLNKLGDQIKLTRKLGSKEFQLFPNDIKYIFPIPESEVIMSNLKQNPR